MPTRDVTLTLPEDLFHRAKVLAAERDLNNGRFVAGVESGSHSADRSNSVVVEDRRALTEHGNGLAKGHEVATRLTAFGCGDRMEGDFTRLVEFVA